MIMSKSQTLKTEIVADSLEELSFKLQQEYSPKGLPASKVVNSLVTLTFDDKGKVKYHKVRLGFSFPFSLSVLHPPCHCRSPALIATTGTMRTTCSRLC